MEGNTHPPFLDNSAHDNGNTMNQAKYNNKCNHEKGGSNPPSANSTATYESEFSQPLLDEPQQQQQQQEQCRRDENEMNFQFDSMLGIGMNLFDRIGYFSRSSTNTSPLWRPVPNNRIEDPNTLLDVDGDDDEHHHHQQQLRKPLLALIMTMILSVCTTELFDQEIAVHHHHHHKEEPIDPNPTPNQPIIETRFDHVLQCAMSISPHRFALDFENVTSPRLRVVEWFVFGPGSQASLSNCQQPTSEFASTYILLLLRESFNIVSWTDPPRKTVRGGQVLGKLCHQWHRLSCQSNSNNNNNNNNNLQSSLWNIESLHFADFNLTGTIPPELSMLSYSLRRLELYENRGLVGTLPSELGKLQSLNTFLIHRTSVSGTIPLEFGSLIQLTQLLLDHTYLTGRMPSSVCSLRPSSSGGSGGALVELHADCAENAASRIQCDYPQCCTSCSSSVRTNATFV